MNDKEREHLKMVTDMHHDALVTMQAALIEWKHGKGAKAVICASTGNTAASAAAFFMFTTAASAFFMFAAATAAFFVLTASAAFTFFVMMITVGFFHVVQRTI